MTFKLDSGAQVNIIPIHLFNKCLNKPEVQKTNLTVSTYTGQLLPIIGVCILKCEVNNKTKHFTFAIISMTTKPVLGLEACVALGLITRNSVCNVLKSKPSNCEELLEQYKDVFEGYGRFKGTYKITLSEDAVPHISAPRRIPQALHDKVKSEIDQMEKDGIITAVHEPTDWVSNMVVIEKTNGIRICLDPRSLNKFIKRPRHPIPTIEELLARLGRGYNIYLIWC